MSEELLQTTPILLGRYLFYKLGNSTLMQLNKAKIIRSKIPQKIANKKPDGLILSSSGDIKAVIEYKTPDELRGIRKVQNAIQQELEVARNLCKLLIVSSGDKTFWVNALNGETILTQEGDDLIEIFDAKAIIEQRLSPEKLNALEELLDKIEFSLTESNNQIFEPEVLDPSKLARSMWQKIWINTGKEPEKCLYNVVELFVFKFLSDVGVLRAHNNFQSVYRLIEDATAQDGLTHYANISRREIHRLFPEGRDGTTIINGTIFVNERGEPNLSQARLFGEVLTLLQFYDNQFGSFKYIKKDFKTRLYESFLRQSAGVRFLGQYFTPRNVVQAMVAMSDAKNLKEGARICDPFCGVGGFILETIASNPHIFRQFEPVNGIVNPKIILRGFDKGSSEKEDERTIVLAKANMLIYFSDLLARYSTPDYLKSFSEGAFNQVFELIRSNLGTFGVTQEEPFDLILTNPPYVTSGSSSLKATIDDEGLRYYYTSGGRGTEALALEWIVKNLKPNGQALVVVPDGLLNQTTVLNFLLQECIIQAVVSLPKRTFYSTPKKTYILVFTKKYTAQERQHEPIFTYIIKEIGESRDARRLPNTENNLTQMVLRFNQFKSSPSQFVPTDPECKIIPVEEFQMRSHWMIDRWWSTEEKSQLGMIEDEDLSNEEFILSIKALDTVIQSLLVEYDNNSNIDDLIELNDYPIKEVLLDHVEDDITCFSMSIGKRVLKKDILETGIPIYSANVNKIFGYVESSNIQNFSIPSLLWGIDGIFDWNYIPSDKIFATTDHCGVLRVLHPNLDPKYIYYALKATKDIYGFDRTYRASLRNIATNVTIRVPILEDGTFDILTQRNLASRYERFYVLRSNTMLQIDALLNNQIKK